MFDGALAKFIEHAARYSQSPDQLAEVSLKFAASLKQIAEQSSTTRQDNRRKTAMGKRDSAIKEFAQYGITKRRNKLVSDVMYAVLYLDMYLAEGLNDAEDYLATQLVQLREADILSKRVVANMLSWAKLNVKRQLEQELDAIGFFQLPQTEGYKACLQAGYEHSELETILFSITCDTKRINAYALSKSKDAEPLLNFMDEL